MCDEQHLLVEFKICYDVVGNQHCYDQAIDGNDTRHDDGDDGPHDELRPHDRHGGDPRAALGCAVGCSQGWRENMRRELFKRTVYKPLCQLAAEVQRQAVPSMTRV